MPTTSASTAATQRQFERRRQALDDQRRDLAPLAQAQAELALRGIGDEVPELHREGLVEPEVGAQLRALLRRCVLAEQVGDRIADVLEQQERDEGHRQHHDDGLEQAAEDEGEHARRSVRKRHGMRSSRNASRCAGDRRCAMRAERARATPAQTQDAATARHKKKAARRRLFVRLLEGLREASSAIRRCDAGRARSRSSCHERGRTASARAAGGRSAEPLLLFDVRAVAYSAVRLDRL